MRKQRKRKKLKLTFNKEKYNKNWHLYVNIIHNRLYLKNNFKHTVCHYIMIKCSFHNNERYSDS